MMHLRPAAVVLAAIALSAPAFAETPREVLIQAAFQTRDKTAALAQVAAAEAAALATLKRQPDDHEALLARAMAVGYRAKLTRNRGDAVIARTQFEALVARNAQDAEAQAALGGWHMEAVGSLGAFVARAALGARKAAGLSATDRAVALGGGRALFAGLAGLLRLALDPADAAGRALIDTAAGGTTPTPLDRVVQRRAAAMQGTIKTGDKRAIQALARRLLPLGQVAP